MMRWIWERKWGWDQEWCFVLLSSWERTLEMDQIEGGENGVKNNKLS